MEQAQEAKHEAPLPTKGAVFKVVCNSKLRAGFAMTSADKGVVKVHFLFLFLFFFHSEQAVIITVLFIVGSWSTKKEEGCTCF